MLARDVVGGVGLAELQAELGGGIVERLDRLDGTHQPLRHAAEGEFHLEALIGHLQVPELVLQHDGHLLGILLLEALRHRDPIRPRVEGDVEVMLAGETSPIVRFSISPVVFSIRFFSSSEKNVSAFTLYIITNLLMPRRRQSRRRHR